jgi:hypothetical protein
MKISALPLLFYLFFITTNCFAQKNNFTPGYYIKQNGDTVKGFINVKNENQITTFNYKKLLLDSNSITLYFDNCSELVSGTESFVNWSGTMRMTYIDKFEMAIKNPDKFNTGSFSLHLLFYGEPLSLYYYHNLFDHYFVKKGDSIAELFSSYRYITEWEKSSYITNSPTYIINPTYRNQIIALMQDALTKKQLTFIENLDYDKQSLIKLFKSIDKGTIK